MIDNPQDTNLTVGEVTIAPHNIWVLVKVKDGVSIDPNDTTTDGAKHEKEVAEIILHYKSLGSGTMNSATKGGPAHNPQVTIDGINYEIKFNETGTKNIYVKVGIKLENTKDKTTIEGKVKEAVVDYINSLEIGQDVLMSRVVSAISSKNTSTDYGFDVSSITIGTTEDSTTTMVSVYQYEQAKTKADFITVTTA